MYLMYTCAGPVRGLEFFVSITVPILVIGFCSCPSEDLRSFSEDDGSLHNANSEEHLTPDRDICCQRKRGMEDSGGGSNPSSSGGDPDECGPSRSAGLLQGAYC
uniref:Uncharacterized protein n=1 Tax=Parascaris equorum TaxID=6256 RepID=A0A914RTD9_PAREQ